MSTVDSALLLMVAFKSGSITAFPLRENVHWTSMLKMAHWSVMQDLAVQRSLVGMKKGIPWTGIWQMIKT